MRNLPLPLPRFGSFHRLFDDLMMQALPTVEPTATPRLDIWEDDQAYGIAVELPGFTLDDIELTVDEHELSIVARQTKNVDTTETTSETTSTAESNLTAEAPKGETNVPARTWHRRERVQRHYARKIQLPHDIDAQNAEAKLENGLLEITLPKSKTKRPVRIQVRP
ncbi:MAG: Hsp20/alpha crystallin family protein [Planctomycetes bacterium]|nr:Hsp20/alpha crystallin family protein [Planctomycetota bacterium]